MKLRYLVVKVASLVRPAAVEPHAINEKYNINGAKSDHELYMRCALYALCTIWCKVITFTTTLSDF